MTTPMVEKSLITTDVDLDRPGKQFGNLLVPQSTNSAGWSVYPIPIIVIRGGEGPTALLFGGNHGDEYEGPVTLMKAARSLSADDVQGRLIIVPMLNRPAVAAGTRLSPLDGANMNRAFPGKADDSITGMIAHYVSSTLLPLADLVVDIHSGGSSMHFLPSVNMHQVEDRQQMEKMLAAGRAWGAPYVFIYRDIAGSGLLPTLAEQMGKVTLGTEIGSKAQFGVEMLDIASRGVTNVLRWLGVLAGSPDTIIDGEPKLVAADDPRDYVMAPVSGIYEPLLELGDIVTAGEPIGQVHNIEQPEQEPVFVSAQTNGMLMGRRSNPLTSQGECLATVVRPMNS
jgi:predicted deacylase